MVDSVSLRCEGNKQRIKVKMPDNDSVVIEVTFNAPIENVWKAWTDPALILRWFGSDPNGTELKANLDVQPGGSFEVTFKDADQTEHTCCGVYQDVLEFHKLIFSWVWKSEPGVESFVTVMLTSEKTFTRMIFEHAHLGMSSKHNYLVGWQSTFFKLEQLLQAPADQ